MIYEKLFIKSSWRRIRGFGNTGDFTSSASNHSLPTIGSVGFSK